MTLCAVALQEVGIDVEYLRALPSALELAQRYFTPSETQQLLSLTEPERIHAFFACWTRKEAYIKALGKGLFQSLKEFEVSLLPSEPPCLKRIQHAPLEEKQWSLFSFEPHSNYIAALAIQNIHCQIQMMP